MKKVQRIYMVTGKGGVGKSAVAMALAQKKAREGQRVLLIELGEHSYFEHAMGVKIQSHAEPELQPGLHVTRWTGETCLRDYVEHLLPVKRLVNIFFENKIMRTFLRAAPAIRELSILGKLTSSIRNIGPKMNYDVLILDAYASGHYLALLRSPVGLSELVERGPMGEQTRDIQKVLMNSEVTKHIIVSLPDALPAQETRELSETLRAEFQISPYVLTNKCVETRFTEDQLNQLRNSDSCEKSFINFLSHKIDSLKYASERKLPFVLKAKFKDVSNSLSHSLPEGL